MEQMQVARVFVRGRLFNRKKYSSPWRYGSFDLSDDESEIGELGPFESS